MNQNYKEVNAVAERKSEEGVLRMWRDMIRLRREHEDSFGYGRFEMPDLENKEVIHVCQEKGEGGDVCCA